MDTAVVNEEFSKKISVDVVKLVFNAFSMCCKIQQVCRGPMLPAKIIIGKSPVSTNADGLISLTDLWKAARKIRHQQPNKWLSHDDTQEFVRKVKESGISPSGGEIATKTGPTGGTFAHWQIALAYAKYLSPELHMAVNEVFMRYEAGDPTLAEEVIEKVVERRVGLTYTGQVKSSLDIWGGCDDC